MLAQVDYVNISGLFVCLYVYLPEEAYVLIELVQIKDREYTTINCDIEIIITFILNDIETELNKENCML